MSEISNKNLRYLAKWHSAGNKPRLKSRIPYELMEHNLTLCACVNGLGSCDQSVLNTAGLSIGKLAKGE